MTMSDKLVEDLRTATAVASYDSGKYLEIIERASLKLYGRVLSTDEFATRIEHDPKGDTNIRVLMHCQYDGYEAQWVGTLPEAPKGADKVVTNGITYSIVGRQWEFSDDDQLLVIELEPVL